MFPLRVIGPPYDGTTKGLLFRVVLSDAQYHQMFCVFQSNGHADSQPSLYRCGPLDALLGLINCSNSYDGGVEVGTKGWDDKRCKRERDKKEIIKHQPPEVDQLVGPIKVVCWVW